MQNKEIITEKELLELANRYIQLQQEFDEYKKNSEYLIYAYKSKYESLENYVKEINQLKTK